jgi:hypothetical protein
MCPERIVFFFPEKPLFPASSEKRSPDDFPIKVIGLPAKAAWKSH